MRPWFRFVLLLGSCTLALAACSPANAPTAPAGVTVLVNGKPLPVTGKVLPHLHDDKLTYVQLSDLNNALNPSRVQIAGEPPVVTVNEKAIEVPAGAKGPHYHDTQFFVPVQGYAAAAGYAVKVDAATGTIELTR